MTDKLPMHASRGAIILCDYLAPMGNGKFLIAGTYTNVDTFHDRVGFPLGLNAYVRFQIEQTKAHFKAQLIARDESPTQPALFTIQGDLESSSLNNPVEIAIRTPPFTIVRPRPLEPGTSLVLSYTLWAEVNGSTLASAPLIITFRNPPPGALDVGHGRIHGPENVP